MTDGLVIFQDSAPYRRVLKTLFLNSLTLVFVLTFLDLHGLLSVANAWLAFEILVFISFFVSPLVVILEPKYMKSSISSISFPWHDGCFCSAIHPQVFRFLGADLQSNLSCFSCHVVNLGLHVRMSV